MGRQTDTLCKIECMALELARHTTLRAIKCHVFGDNYAILRYYQGVTHAQSVINTICTIY